MVLAFHSTGGGRLGVAGQELLAKLSCAPGSDAQIGTQLPDARRFPAAARVASSSVTARGHTSVSVALSPAGSRWLPGVGLARRVAARVGPVVAEAGGGGVGARRGVGRHACAASAWPGHAPGAARCRSRGKGIERQKISVPVSRLVERQAEAARQWLGAGSPLARKGNDLLGRGAREVARGTQPSALRQLPGDRTRTGAMAKISC